MKKLITEEVFWRLISSSVKDGIVNSTSINTLVESLSKFPADEIVNFECILRQKLLQANNDLHYTLQEIIEGEGGSTDGFLYFRCWLIINGDEFFRYANEFPDKLPLLPNFRRRILDPSAEELLYVSESAYAESKGIVNSDLVWEEMYRIRELRCPGADYDSPESLTLSPSKISFNRESLQESFPNLWKECRK